MLTDEQLREGAEICRELSGGRLTEAEAQQYAQMGFEILRAVYKPIPLQRDGNLCDKEYRDEQII